MDKQKKHYIITALTLGCIAAVAGGIIGVTNMLTRDKILQNEKNKINQGIVEIFGKNAKASEEKKLQNSYKYVEYYYEVDTGENYPSYAFRTTGSNMYGKISLLVGLKDDDFKGITVIVNEQTYATTLVDNYLVPVNDGKRDIEDVSCGATYGAKLVRDMINDAKEAMGELMYD